MSTGFAGLRSRFHSSLHVWLVSAFLLVVVFIFFLLLLGRVRALHAGVRFAYRAGDCSATLAYHARLRGLLGWFPQPADVRQSAHVCEQYRSLVAGAEHLAPEVAAASIDAFLGEFRDTPVTWRAMFALEGQYLTWAAQLRDRGEFESALALYERAAEVGATAGAAIRTELGPTYVQWGRALQESGKYKEAAHVFATAVGLDAPVRAAVEPARAQFYLDWGAWLSRNTSYADAERVYRDYLQLALDRFAPLEIPADAWQPLTPYPYAVVAPHGDLRVGPDLTYAPVTAPVVSGPEVCAVVGVTPDGLWLAANCGQAVSVAPDAEAREIEWPVTGASAIVWLPSDQAEVFAQVPSRLPLAGPMLHELARHDPPSASAIAALRELYTAWATAAGEQGDAATQLAALFQKSALVTDESEAAAVRADIAACYTAEARALSDAGGSRAAVERARYGRDYALTTSQMQASREIEAGSLVQVGRAETQAGHWPAALKTLTGTVALEATWYGKGWATVVKQTGLYAQPTADKAALSVSAGSRFAAVARTAIDRTSWLLLLTPLRADGVAWVAASAVTLTVPLADLPAADPAQLGRFYSGAAGEAIVEARLAWAAAGHKQRDFELAVGQYRELLQATDLPVVISDTLDLLGGVLLDWGGELVAQGQPAEANLKYLAILGTATHSSARVEAENRLSGLVPAVDAQPCETLAALDVLVAQAADRNLTAQLEGALKTKLSDLMPSALHLCATANAAQGEPHKAVQGWLRLLGAFPAGPVAAKAQQALAELLSKQIVGDVCGIANVLLEAPLLPTKALQELQAQALFGCAESKIAAGLYVPSRQMLERIVTDLKVTKYGGQARSRLNQVAWLIKWRAASLETRDYYLAEICRAASAKVKAKPATLISPYQIAMMSAQTGDTSSYSRFFFDGSAEGQGPKSWRFDSSRDAPAPTVLVCVAPQKEVIVGGCPYEDGYWLDRVVLSVPLYLIDPLTGNTVAAGRIATDEPYCPWFHTFYQKRQSYYGSFPLDPEDGDKDILVWMQKFLKK